MTQSRDPTPSSLTHSSEIRKTVAGRAMPAPVNRVWVVYDPHPFSRFTFDHRFSLPGCRKRCFHTPSTVGHKAATAVPGQGFENPQSLGHRAGSGFTDGHFRFLLPTAASSDGILQSKVGGLWEVLPPGASPRYYHGSAHTYQCDRPLYL